MGSSIVDLDICVKKEIAESVFRLTGGSRHDILFTTHRVIENPFVRSSRQTGR